MNQKKINFKGDIYQAITFFIPALNGGGAQKVVVNLANALSELVDRPIHIVLARAEGEFLVQVRPEVEIVDLGTKRASRSILALARYLKKVRPAVFCSSMNYANVVASIAWHLSGRPGRLILREDNVVRLSNDPWPMCIRKRGLHFLMGLLYPRSDMIVAISKDVAQSLWTINICKPEQTVIIGNPITIPTKDAIEKPNAIHRDIGYGIPYICAVGRLTPQKGFDVLLNAFSRLKISNLHLVILGEGKLRIELGEQARRLGIHERVYMPGFVQAPEQVIKDAKLFVFSSRWEGFGNVLVEALGTGTPVVATDCPGAPADILHQGILGHLVTPDDPNALAQAIQEALHSPKGTVEARKARAQDFAAPTIAKQYLVNAFKLNETSDSSLDHN